VKVNRRYEIYFSNDPFRSLDPAGGLQYTASNLDGGTTLSAGLQRHRIGSARHKLDQVRGTEGGSREGYRILLETMSRSGAQKSRESHGARKRGTPAKTIAPDPLQSLAERVRQARARRGMTRKQLARDSGVSERYLAQIEAGQGNISVLVLRQLAKALNLSLDALLFEGPEPAVELVHTVEFLRRLSIGDLKLARQMLLDQFGGADPAARHRRIAFIGLRGAGKSTLGAALAQRLEMPFLELDGLIQREIGLTLDLIFDFHGQAGFRRLERQCLEDVLQRYPRFVMATGGSLVSESGTFERLLSSCFTVWVRASPEEHMQRVIAQGDMRPMVNNRDAMSDLKRILSEREVLYSNADIQIDTSGRTFEESLELLIQSLRDTPVRETLAPVGVFR
jgi:XRE family transcriptional regulator, aerobic/anaerobic benzoate catabolism transcriptional regulator